MSYLSLCLTCNGDGKLLEERVDDNGIYMKEISCPNCKGEGRVEELEWKDIGTKEQSNTFTMSRTEAEDLKKFLYENGYISYEFHASVHEILRRLNKFLGD